MACFVLREWPLQLSRKSRHKGDAVGVARKMRKRERERERIVKVGPLREQDRII